MPKCRFFFSALSSIWKELEERNLRGFNELISYHEFKNSKHFTYDRLNELSQVRGELMLDSGAFSAWNSKKPIDIQEFIKFHKELEKECPQITIRAGLDDIENWEQGLRNQELTDAVGLALFPTYHRQDPPEVLDWIIDRGYKFIGLGGLVSGALKEPDKLLKWLGETYARFCDPEGTPILQTHLFGVSNLDLVKAVPATTNDSASALFTGSFGVVWLPSLCPNSLKPDFSLPMVRLAVSKESPAQANANAHFHTLRPAQKELVNAYVESQGFTIQGLVDHHEDRKCFCVQQMVLQTEAYPEDVKFKPAPKEFDFLSI
jgi:hypothetical protein